MHLKAGSDSLCQTGITFQADYRKCRYIQNYICFFLYTLLQFMAD